MRHLLTILLALLPWTFHAQNVIFQSGTPYRIQCVGWGQGGIVPGSTIGDPAVLIYTTDISDAERTLWTITAVGTDEQGNTTYTLRHKATGLYATYDGLRDDNKRYVALTEKTQGNASRWTFIDRGGSWSIDNVKAPEHHFHVRSSMLTGTYADDQPPGNSSRFVLVGTDGKTVTHLTPPEPAFDNLVSDFRFDGKPAVYDAATHTYLVTVPPTSRRGKTARMMVEYQADGEVEVDYISTPTGHTHDFANYSGGTTFSLLLRTPNGDTYPANLAFTILPIVELTGNFSPSTSAGYIRVSDPNTDGEDPLLNMRAHWRGNTSLNRAKKNYAVKLTDSEGKSIDQPLLGLRNDNNWILDAAFVDPSRVRNRVSTDIWNDFRTPPYYAESEPKARTATRGAMVEVFLNGKYEGLYCMTEKLDRKQLKLKKIETTDDDGNVIADPPQRGILYKAVEWDYTTYFGYDNGVFTGVHPPEPLNTSESWGGWEIKYPDLGDGQPIDWAPLYQHVDFMATCTDTKFKREVAERFDLPVMRDYYLLQELAMAFDNSAKNIYWFIYDAAESTKLSLAPWDFDGTWGRIWKGTKGHSNPLNTLRDNSGSLLSANKIYSYLMRLNYDGWNAQLAARYAQLRSDGTFAPQSLKARFDDYFALISESGAATREVARWDGNSGFNLGWDEELRYLHEWIDTHVTVLDAYYNYDPIVGVTQHQAAPTGTIHVYTPDGRRITTITADSGRQAESMLRELPHGIYIIQGRKIKL